MEIQKKIVKLGNSLGIVVDQGVLGSLGLKEGDYVLADMKRKICFIDFSKDQMPKPFQMPTDRDTYDGWIILDTGDHIQFIYKPRAIGYPEKRCAPMMQTFSKLSIVEIKPLKKIPFKLDRTHIRDMRTAQERFPNQWKANPVPKVMEVMRNPEIADRFLEKINQIGKKISKTKIINIKANVQQKNKSNEKYKKS